MKRIFTLITAIVALATTASAQLRFGVEAGLDINQPSSFSKSAAKDLIKPGNSLGWFIGPKVMFKVPIVGLGVDGAILFNQKKNDMGESSKTLQYINIPINARYQIGLGSLAALYLAAGPQWSVNVGDRDWSWTDMSQASNLGSQYFKAAKSNLSINLGAGVVLLSHLNVGFTYNIPLTKSGEALYTDPSSSATAIVDTAGDIISNFKSNSWQIRASWIF